MLRLAALFVWIVVGGRRRRCCCGCGRAGGSRGRRSPRSACVLVAADLLRIGMGINPAIPVDHARAARHARRSSACRRRGPARFAGLAPELGLQPLVPDTAMRYGLYDARGYDYPIERRYDTLWRRAVAPPRGFTPPTLLVEPDDEALRALGLLGVTDVIQPPGEPRVPGWEVSYDGDDARLYSNPHACRARGWWRASATVAGEDAALDAILDPGVRPAADRDRRAAGRGARGRPGRGRRGADRALRARPGRALGDAPTGARSSCSPTCTSRAGRRRSTAARCRSSGSTTCCAACPSTPGATGSRSPTGPRAGGSAGS